MCHGLGWWLDPHRRGALGVREPLPGQLERLGSVIKTRSQAHAGRAEPAQNLTTYAAGVDYQLRGQAGGSGHDAADTGTAAVRYLQVEHALAEPEAQCGKVARTRQERTLQE